ncbi:MAG: helix-turn-helix transcriptional regulator [Candidatus Hydrogenedentes bacterium]|nr:helix-turn-helix transcriptional regulator [Candidatus Hydrogenedentota bacterium]
MLKNTPLRNRVKELRERLDVRQSALARDVGITRQTIIAIEKGRLNPSIVICLKIAKLLREPVDYIFYLEPGYDYAAEAAANAGRPKRGRKKRVPIVDAATPEAVAIRHEPEPVSPAFEADRDAAAVEYERDESFSEAEAEEIELVDSVPEPATADDGKNKGEDPKGGQAIWDFF